MNQTGELQKNKRSRRQITCLLSAGIVVIAGAALVSCGDSHAESGETPVERQFIPLTAMNQGGAGEHPVLSSLALKSNKSTNDVHFDDIKPEYITHDCISCHVNKGIDLSTPQLRTADGEKGPAFYSGGEMGTTFNNTSRAFEQPSPASEEAGLDAEFLAGEGIFEGVYVTTPDVPFTGLGPVYMKSSCIACHPGYGRSRRQTDFNKEYGNGYIAFVHNPDGSPVKGYTKMLQTKSIPPFKTYAEGVSITWNEYKDKYNNMYPDGTPYNAGKPTEGSLSYPTADLINPLLPLPDDYTVSLEATIGIFGTALLDAISEEDILAEYKRQQAQNGPIKGMHGPWIEQPDGQVLLGRFTWHCERANLENGPGSNGVWNTFNLIRPDRRELYQTQEWLDKHKELGIDVSQLEGEQPVEMSQADFDNFMIWHRSLAVPAFRNLEDPAVQRGRKIFNDIGCASCHKPEWTTSAYPAMPAYENQVIRPYTDMLMHDMGEINKGTSQTWRTPPLWGRGMMKKTADHTDMFHDLRARDFEEAILWHFGESEFARERFRHLSSGEREDLIRFIKAL